MRRLTLIVVALLALVVSCDGDAGSGGDGRTSAATPATATEDPASTVTPPREVPPGRSYTNPVYDHEAPDPAVMRDEDGTYYVYSTQSVYDGEVVHVPVLRSRDLVRWTFLGDALPTHPAWGGEETWAPHVDRRSDGTYVLYVSVRSNDLDVMQVVAAIADRAEGPFEPLDEPFLDPSDETIDPFVLRTTDGELFFYWSVDNTVRVQRLREDGLHLMGPSEVVLVHIGEEGTGYDSVVEGAWVTEHDGRFYLFTSGDICCGEDAHYAVSVAVSDSPMGPFERNPSNPVLEAGGPFFAPGHNSVAVDDAGDHWIVYHAMPVGTRSFDRIMLIDRVRWVDGWPVVDDVGVPSSEPRREPRIDRS